MNSNTRYLIILLPFLAVLAMMPSGATGQNNVDRSLVEEALARTDEIINDVQSLIDETMSQKARARITLAIELQKRAWDNFNGNRYRTALELTKEARQEANQAKAMARIETQAEAMHARLIEETMERIASASNILLEYDLKDTRPRKLIQQARDLAGKSMENARQYRYQLAIKLAQTARDHAVEAEKQARTIRSVAVVMERRLELAERLMERAREMIGNIEDENAVRQLRMAERQLTNARNLYGEAKYRAAKMMMERCEKTLRSLIRRFRSYSPEDPTAMIDEAHRLLERAEEIVGNDPPDPETDAAMNRARELIALAEERLSTGRIDAAKLMLAEARRTLQGAIRKGAGEISKEGSREIIIRAERKGEQILDILVSCKTPGAETLYERASTHLDKARQYQQESRFQGAAAEARIALNMFNRIIEICSGH